MTIKVFSFLCLALVVGLPEQIIAAIPLSPGNLPSQASRTASGNSWNPGFSADGRHVVFVSQAHNLVTNDDAALSLDVFVYDQANRTTILASVNTNGIGGGNRDANYPSISSNGQWVAFASAASNLVPGDTNEWEDVFVRDLASGITRLVSVDDSGLHLGNGKSGAPLLSGDGRWVVFESFATNLVPGQFTTNLPQLYVRDMQSGGTRLVSVNAEGTGPGEGKAVSASMSADGRRVAFVSMATNLVADVTNQLGEIYVRDLPAGTTRWISSQVAEFVAESREYRCLNPVISGNGARLAFKAICPATNVAYVFWCELSSGELVCVDTNADPSINAWPQLSEDGGRLIYERGAGLFLWDCQSRSNQLVDVCYNGVGRGNRPAETPVLSADGQTVVFLSAATDLIASNSPGSLALSQVYSRNLATQVTTLITQTTNGWPSAISSAGILPAVSWDGKQVAFESADGALVEGDWNCASDIFVFDQAIGSNQLVTASEPSRASRFSTGHALLETSCLSSNGRYAVILAFDSNLAPGDDNQVADAYALDLVTGTNSRLFVGSNCCNATAQFLIMPTISPAGDLIAFLRAKPDETAPTEGFVFRRSSGESRLFNLTPTGTVASNVLCDVRYGKPCFSSAGQKIAFCSQGSSLIGGIGGNKNIFVYNYLQATNQLITMNYSTLQSGNGDSYCPQFSPDGRWLAFLSCATNLVTSSHSRAMADLFVCDMSMSNTVEFDRLWATNAVFSPCSQYLFFNTMPIADENAIYRYKLSGPNKGITSIILNGSKPVACSNAEVVAFQTLPTNRITQVFAWQAASSNLECISIAPDGVTPGNGISEPPQITPDGRFVVFASRASNLVANDNNEFKDVFLRDRQLGLTYLLSANGKTGRSGNGPSGNPVLSADGSTVVFTSMANDLVEGDYNDKQDIFVVKLTSGDVDGDGLDDGWEMAYFGNLNRDGSGDLDGDGIPDRDEYRAGTDPTNQGSVLRALVMSSPGVAQATLRWPAGKGNHYKIQYKSSLNDADWADLATTINVNGNTASASDPNAGMSTTRFYRIVLLP